METGDLPILLQDDTTYDIYLHDERTLDFGTNLESAFVQNAAANKQRREFDSFSCETPPGYEESLYRQRMLKLHNRSCNMHIQWFSYNLFYGAGPARTVRQAR